MNQVIFNSPQFGDIRTVGDSVNPLFCLVDVCKALALTPNKVVQRLDDGVLSKYPMMDKLGREQLINFVNEDGLYDVILDSRKPEAKAFRKWITSEVLPSIRTKGGYIATTAEDTSELIMARALQVAQQTIQKHQQRLQMLEGENEIYRTQIKEIAPKAEYTDHVLQSTSTYTFTQVAKELDFSSCKKFTDKLFDLGVIYKQSGQWQLKAKYAGREYTSTRTAKFFHRDGTPGSSISTVWTEKGRQFLHNLLKSN